MSKLNIRFMKQQMTKNVYTNFGTDKQRTFRSIKNQFLHDLRFETMESGYLKRPEEKNKNEFFGIMENSDNENNFENVKKSWKKIEADFKKHNGKKIHRQTKQGLNFLLSFEKDFDLSEENRVAQFKSVKKYILENFDYPLYLVQHNDEKSLHYSFTVLNYSNTTHRPIAKQIDTSLLQDSIADHLKKDGQDYGHTRGVKKEISDKDHKTIMEGKVQDLEKENKALKVENDELKKEYQTTINAIINGLEDLNEQTTIEDFLRLLTRYLKGAKKDKIENFLKKYKRKLNAKQKKHNKEIAKSNIDFVNKNKQTDTTTETIKTTTNKGE